LESCNLTNFLFLCVQEKNSKRNPTDKYFEKLEIWKRPFTQPYISTEAQGDTCRPLETGTLRSCAPRRKSVGVLTCRLINLLSK